MRKLALLLFFCSSVFSNNAVEIKVNEPGRLIIEVSIDSVWLSQTDGLVHTNPNLNSYINSGSPIIPFWQEVFIGLPSDANVQIYKGESITIGKYNPIVSGAEQAKDMDFKLPIKQKYNGTFNKNLVELSDLGIVNNQLSSKIEIFPFKIINGTLLATKTFSINFSWNSTNTNVRAKPLSEIDSPDFFRKKTLKKSAGNSIPEYQFFPNIAKLTIDTTAWYSISNDELLLNGIDLSGVDQNSIRLWNKASEIPIHIELGNDNIFNDEDILIFFGNKNQSPEGVNYDNNFYTDDNIYWLTWGTGIGSRYNKLDVSPDLTENEVVIPPTFRDTIKIERDDEYVRLPKINEYILQTWDVIDHFFMAPKIIVSGQFDFNFQLDSPDLTSIDGFDLEVQVRGMATVNHDLDILINNNLVGNSQWSARDANHFNLSKIDCSYLQDGQNTFSLILSPNDPSANDLIYLNWYKLVYPRLFNTNSDYIKFTSGENTGKNIEFEISGFSSDNIYIFKDRQENLFNFNTNSDNKITFQDSSDDRAMYEVITRKKFIKVKNIYIESPITNNLHNINTEYIIIAPDSFFTILEPLANYHNAVIVDVEDVYRQYSYGILSPYGIKSFLNDIYDNGKLKYVLFTMSCDEINWINGKFDHIPSIPAMFIYSYNMGAVVCDYWYGTFDEEFWKPNIYIGRFPINTKAQLQNIVDKTMYHHTRNITDWDNNVLLIGGSDLGFTFQSEALINNIKKSGNFISRLYAAQSSNDSSYYGTADTLADHFSRGLSYINFFGHGGGRVWEDNGLLTFNNISNLNNSDKFPFITSMSCHTGDFSFNRALSRQMVEYADGGALAWYSASGLGWYYNDYYMTVPLQELLFSENDLTIGEVINLSKTKYYLAYSDAYPEIAATQVYQYNLIGDPGIKLKNPVLNSVSIEPLDPERGETIKINSEFTNSESMHYQLFFPDNNSINHSLLLDDTPPFELSLADTLQKGIYNLNLSYTAQGNFYNANEMFSISGSYVNILSTVPTNPTICDSIGVLSEVKDRNGISSVQLFINDEYWSDMRINSDNYYELDQLILPQPSGTSLNLHCLVIDTYNDTTISNNYPIEIGEIPDIIPVSGGFFIDDSINVIVDIESSTTTPVEVYANLFIYTEGSWDLLGQDTVMIEGKGIIQAKFSNYFPIGVNEYRVITIANLSCQSTDIVADDTLNFELETTAFWVTPELGTTDDGKTHSEVGIGDIQINIPSGSVGHAQIIKIEKLNNIEISSQPDFNVIDVPNGYVGFEIKTEEEVQYSITWILDQSFNDQERKLYQYFDRYQVWLPIEYSFQNDTSIVFLSSESAMFAFLENNDIEKPTLSAAINNQKYLENIYINKDPNIQIVVYDRNGIDFRKSGIDISMNEQDASETNYVINGSANSLTLEFSPSLTSLDSSMSILITDAAGNLSDTFRVSFIVSEKMDVLDYGNFPNPFSDRTIFAYELTEEVDNLTITIYSVEGRTIRKLTDENIVTGPNMNLPGYHEIEWDGRNTDRNEIDNGNYFYQIRAKKNKKIIAKNGKIVKIR